MVLNERGAGAGRGFPWRVIGWGLIGVLLLIPLVAMQFTREVAWTAFDFVTFGALLVFVGGACELAAWRSGSGWYRAGAALGATTAMGLVLVTGAVGIIASERHPANLLYLGLLVIVLAAGVVVRFRAVGLAVVLAGAALAQATIAGVAVALGWTGAAPNLPWDTIGASGMFVVLWLGAAGLFWTAHRET